MKPPRIQTPRIALTANVPLTAIAHIDALGVKLDCSRHAILLRCIDLALPLLDQVTVDQQAGDLPRSA